MAGFEGEDTQLSDALVDAVATGRIGRPVFVRWTGRAGAGAAGEAADSALGVAARVFGGEPESTHRLETAAGRQATVLGRWPGGESALIAIGPAGTGGRAGTDVVLVGTRGAVYHEFHGGGG